jgi:hypothetical protein
VSLLHLVVNYMTSVRITLNFRWLRFTVGTHYLFLSWFNDPMVTESGVRTNDPVGRSQEVKYRHLGRLVHNPKWVVIPFTINVDKNRRVIVLSATLNYLL